MTAGCTTPRIAAEFAEAESSRLLSWRDLLLSAGLATAAIFITGDAWCDIIRLGTKNEELSYVFIAPLAIAWLVWARRSRFNECRRRSGTIGVLILALGWLMYWRGFISDPVLWRAGAVMTTIGAALAALGWDTLLRFLPAIGAAVFLVPVSPNGRYQLAVPLQEITASAAQRVCDLLGMAVDQHGTVLTINGVDVAVAEACNGMRMILTLLLVCYVVAFALPLRSYVRLMLLACSPAVAVASNVLRLVPTVWMYGRASANAAERMHALAGWVMSAVAFLLLVGMLQAMRWMRIPVMCGGTLLKREGAA